jgi:hypothetical protein
MDNLLQGIFNFSPAVNYFKQDCRAFCVVVQSDVETYNNKGLQTVGSSKNGLHTFTVSFFPTV